MEREWCCTGSLRLSKIFQESRENAAVALHFVRSYYITRWLQKQNYGLKGPSVFEVIRRAN